MFAVLRHPIFKQLYIAQLVSLVGTGLATVALSLLAYELAGAQAGAVLGTALTIKMVAYVGVSPFAQAWLGKFPAKKVLIILDLVRMCVALCLPFVTEIWQIYLLIFVLQSASAGFTPTFQAQIPQILSDEDDYTQALSLSRATYDLENLFSPLLAAALLFIMPFHWLFGGTAIGFLVAAIFVMRAGLKSGTPKATRPFWDRLTHGTKQYLATPRLRGLLALNFATAAGSAMVLVNSIIVVRVTLGLDEQALTLFLAAYGGGSMIAALTLPTILRRSGDRLPMLVGAFTLSITMILAAFVFSNVAPAILVVGIWFVAGVAYSTTLTPGGRLLNRSTHPGEKAEIFTAHFALSHACWLVTYPLAGWLGANSSLSTAFIVLGTLAFLSTLLAMFLWPRQINGPLGHAHPELPEDHPHLKDAHNKEHRHIYIIDDLHPHWPAHR